jgi:HAMP domain-containing protein
MRLGARVSLFILVAAVAPLLLLSVASGSVASRHLADSVARAELDLADFLAVSVARVMGDADRVIRAQIANFRLDEAADDVRTGFVIATYRLFPEINIATLRGADGVELVPPVYRSLDETEWVDGHDGVDTSHVRRFRKSLPPAPPPGESALGTPYLPEGATAAVIPMAFTSPYNADIVFAAELSLSSVQKRMAASAGEGRSVVLMTLDGQVLAEAGPASPIAPARLKPLLDTPGANAEFEDEKVVAAISRVRGRDWSVVVAEPSSVVRAAQVAMLRPTSYIGAVAALYALVAGWLLSRSLTVPLAQLYDAAKAFGRGNLKRRVPIEGRDEVAEVGVAFNQMAETIQESTRQIEEKNEEIRAFNRELQARVEKRRRDERGPGA